MKKVVEMFAPSVESLIAEKDSALGVFTKTKEKLASVSQKLVAFQQKNAKDITELEAKIVAKHQQNQISVAQQAEINATIGKINSILGK